MKVSVMQFVPIHGQKLENIRTVCRLMENVATDLVVLPELAISGYLFNSPAELIPLAEDMGSGMAFSAFSSLAAKRNCSIVYGYPEFCGGKMFNSSMLINPDGSFYNYRKIHLFDREKIIFNPGDDRFRVYPGKDGIKLGMMICFDWMFPESVRSLALQGAAIICHPANLVLPWGQQAMKTRALENSVYCLTANRFGTETRDDVLLRFTGSSQIISPKAQLLASLPESSEGVATVEIDVEMAHDKNLNSRNNLFNDRRPELYTL